MAFQVQDRLATREEVWGSGAGAAKVLTTGFVTTTTFRTDDHDAVFLETTISGTAPTTLHLKVEVSFNEGTNYNTLDGYGDFQLDGATASQFDALRVPQYALCRISAKRTGGDGTTAALIYGTGRRAEEIDNLSTSALGAIAVEGDVAHDDADAGDPVKTGFRARTSQIGAVANNDRSDAISNAYGEQVIAGYDWTESALDVQGHVAHDAADSGDPLKVGMRARTSQIAAVANNDRSDAVSNEYGEQVNAGYDWTLNAERAQEINPPSEQYAADDLVETNITTNTTSYHYIDMAGYRYFTIQGETSGAAPTDVLTVTVEASCQDDGTAAASCAYQDVTNALFGVASWVDTDFMAISDTPAAFKYVRVKYVTSNDAGNDADLSLYIKKMF